MKRWIILVMSILIISLGLINFLIIKDNENKNDNKYNFDSSKTTTSVKAKKTVNFTFAGDLLFESLFYRAIDNGYDKNTYFKRVKEYFEDDDISVANMEVVIGNENLKVSGDGYNFCAPTFIGDLVSSLDLEILSTANNHANDRGMDGINSTIDYFKNNTDIKTVGTYKNEDDRNNLRIIDVNGIKIGFLAYTYGTNIKIDESNRNLIGLYRDPDTKEFNSEYQELLKKEITNLNNNCDVSVVIMHWGKEFTFTPSDEQIRMAKFLNELGVDIIMGSHSHSMQPIDIIGEDKKTLVYYSMGNFVSHDDDIARTEKGLETFDNAYQIGLLSKVTLEIDNGNINFQKIKTIPIINYFNQQKTNFELIPFEDYNEEYETTHLRYNLGLNKTFIENTFNQVIDKKYQ